MKFYNTSVVERVGRTFTLNGYERQYVNVKVGAMAGWQLNVSTACLEEVGGAVLARGPVAGFETDYIDGLLRVVSPLYLKEGVKRVAVRDERGQLILHIPFADLRRVE